MVQLLLGKMLKAVPVVDRENHVAGIITDGDLLHHAGMPVRLAVGERLEADDLCGFLEQVSQEKTAAGIMTTPVVTVREDEELAHVVRTLLDHNLKRLPVVDSQDKLKGMVSRRDILRAVAGYDAGQPEYASAPYPGRTIGEVMSPHLPVVHVNDDLADVLQALLDADIKRVIVLDEQDKPAGIITDGDMVARVNPGLRQSVLQSLAARILGPDMSRGQAAARDIMSESHVIRSGRYHTGRCGVPDAARGAQTTGRR